MREENQSSKLSKVKANLQKMLKKRWVLPAVYLGLVAVVLSTVIWLQGVPDFVLDESEPKDRTESNAKHPDQQEAVPVAAIQEEFQMPVTNENEVQVIGHFFDVNSPEEQQKAALVLYDNTFFESKGIDLALESGESFDVVATLSGTVVKSTKDALVGNTVHIEHDNDLVTVYQSLEGLDVKEGQSVKQGDVIGRAGRSLFNQGAGVHLHFQVLKDEVPVNPIDYFSQPEDEKEVSDEEASDEEDNVDEDDTQEEQQN